MDWAPASSSWATDVRGAQQPLLARIGARRTISRIMVLWGLTSASMLFVQGEWSFYVLRFMLGVFEVPASA